MAEIITLSLDNSKPGRDFLLHPVLIAEGSELILVDCGVPLHLPLLEAEMERHGYFLTDLTKLILTHHDYDHMGTAAELKKKNKGLEIICSAVEAPYISGAKKSFRLVQAEEEAAARSLSAEEKRRGEKFLSSLMSMKMPSEVLVLETDIILEYIADGIILLDTKGHTFGHISVYLVKDRVLITGDAVVFLEGQLFIPNPNHSASLKEAVLSVKHMMDYPINRMICYHGGEFTGDIERSLKKILDFYNNREKKAVN